MKILFVGGTGIISTACVSFAVEQGHEVCVLNRGNRPCHPAVRQLVADVDDLESSRKALGRESWDAVVDFVTFAPDQVERRIDLFATLTKHYVFISSASAYQRPAVHYLVTESTPLENPFWEYSRNKIACESGLLDAVKNLAFPATIVRPSLTFGDTQIPLAVNSWRKPYTVINRMRLGKPVIVPGDGTSLWTITHNSDFAKGLVGLLGNGSAIGHAFHITSDEVLSWDQIYHATARAAGVDHPDLRHIASDFIVSCMPDEEGSLLGDKATSVVFDNSKIKRFVPGFEATTRFEDGIRTTIAHFDANRDLREIAEGLDRKYDLLLEVYDAGLDRARRAFGR